MPCGRNKENFTKPREKRQRGRKRTAKETKVVAEPGGLSSDPVLSGREG